MDEVQPVINYVRSISENENGLDIPLVHVKQELIDPEIEVGEDGMFSSKNRSDNEPFHFSEPAVNIPCVVKVECEPFKDQFLELNSSLEKKNSDSASDASNFLPFEVCYIKEEHDEQDKDKIQTNSHKQENTILTNFTCRRKEENILKFNSIITSQKINEVKNESGNQILDFKAKLSKKFQSILISAVQSQDSLIAVSEKRPESVNCKTNSEYEIPSKDFLFKPYEFTHTCSLCAVNFASKVELTKHLFFHNNKKKFECSECPMSFDEIQNLKNHSLSHLKRKTYKCSKCDETFTAKFFLKAHLIVHAEKKPYACNICDKGFMSIGALKQHSFRHSNEKPFKCKSCGRAFKDRAALRKHVLLHESEKPFKCEECGKTYAQKNGLKIHSFSHTGEKPFKCAVCGKGFRNNASLKSHSFLHSGVFPFKCKICGKAYRDNTTLKKHLVKHDFNNPNKCHICNKILNGRNNLKNHLLIHTGEKPYKCNECGKIFRSKSYVKEHLFRLHQIGEGTARALASSRRYGKKVIENSNEKEDEFSCKVKIEKNHIKVEDESNDFEIEDQVEVKIEVESENEIEEGNENATCQIKEESGSTLPVVDVVF